MANPIGSDRIASLINYYLDIQSRRMQVTSSNIANADTPGYTAKELDFAEHLQTAAYQVIEPNELNNLHTKLKTNLGITNEDRPETVLQTGNAIGIDGNNVDLGREMATLADTGMQYLQGIQLLQSRLRTLRIAIREGR
ncbi:MAG: flagellar basal body rod protein FlgB [Acidobacteriota bacterium]